jgi:hypothetical protein
MAELRDQISSMRQSLCDCEAEKSSLVARVESLTAELERFKMNERTLRSSHVRISSDPELHPSDRVVDGVYHSSSSRPVSGVAWLGVCLLLSFPLPQSSPLPASGCLIFPSPSRLASHPALPRTSCAN